MDWMQWIGKKVYIETHSERKYTGEVIDVDISKDPKLIWVTITDRFGKKITFVHSEIKLIQEEKNG